MATLNAASAVFRRQIESNRGRVIDTAGNSVLAYLRPIAMVFQAKDPALPEKVKVGDKVQFTAESANGAMMVSMIERVAK